MGTKRTSVDRIEGVIAFVDNGKALLQINIETTAKMVVAHPARLETSETLAIATGYLKARGELNLLDVVGRRLLAKLDEHNIDGREIDQLREALRSIR